MIRRSIWRIPPQNGNLLEEWSSWAEELFFPRKVTWFALQWWSLAQTLGYFVCSSVHSCLSSTVQDTTPEGVLSQCWCSLTLTLTTSIGIWDGAGVTKGVTSHAAHRGVWYGAGATRSSLHSPSWSKSFSLMTKSLTSTEIFYLYAKRNAERWQRNTNVRHKKINPYEWKDMMPRNCWSLVVQLSYFFVEILWFVVDSLWNLSVSLCEGWLRFFLIRGSKLKNSFTKWQSLWRVNELNRAIILSLRIELIQHSVRIISSDSWVV